MNDAEKIEKIISMFDSLNVEDMTKLEQMILKLVCPTRQITQDEWECGRRNSDKVMDV